MDNKTIDQSTSLKAERLAKTIATAAGEDEGTIEEACEPFLIQKDTRRTFCGREVMEAYKTFKWLNRTILASSLADPMPAIFLHDPFFEACSPQILRFFCKLTPLFTIPADNRGPEGDKHKVVKVIGKSLFGKF